MLSYYTVLDFVRFRMDHTGVKGFIRAGCEWEILYFIPEPVYTFAELIYFYALESRLLCSPKIVFTNILMCITDTNHNMALGQVCFFDYSTKITMTQSCLLRYHTIHIPASFWPALCVSQLRWPTNAWHNCSLSLSDSQRSPHFLFTLWDLHCTECPFEWLELPTRKLLRTSVRWFQVWERGHSSASQPRKNGPHR